MPQGVRTDIGKTGRFPDCLEGLGDALNRLAIKFNDRMF